MKRILACFLACLSVAGCAPSEDFMDSLFGIKHSFVILTSSPVELSQVPVTYSPSTEPEVAGKLSSVCVVLAGDVPIKGSEKEGERILNGAKISATVTTGEGATREFSCQGIGWAKSGHVVPSNEITACVHPSCAKQTLPIGSKIRSVSISSTAPVRVLGAYWYSTAAFDQSGN